MISESDVERNATPRSRSSACSSTALIRLPLWASATSRRSARQTGCEFSHEFDAGGRVAHVADRHVALQRAQLLLVEDLVDEALVAHGHDVAALGGGDARRLLAAVLERVEREVGEPGDVVLGRVDAEDAALVARAVAVVEEESREDVDGRQRRGRPAECGAA